MLEADLAIDRRIGSCEEDLLTSRTNLALCLSELGRTAESLHMRREIFADAVRLFGKYHGDTIIDAGNLDPYR